MRLSSLVVTLALVGGCSHREPVYTLGAQHLPGYHVQASMTGFFFPPGDIGFAVTANGGGGYTVQFTDQANSAASTAQNSATAAQNSANAAGARAAAVETAAKRLIFQVVISDAEGNFKLGKSELPDEVRAKLDELATKLKADPNGQYIEIEGHTDSTGTKLVNDKLGLERAENVKRYLYETYQIPLHKINVISYGEDKPVAPNTTRDGRAQNRRVVIKVLA